jgi:mRNA-degrading endonuclease toxin of MazEF toxin-antitoxin module
MPRIYTKVLPVRTVIDVVERTPRWSDAANAPTISFRAKVTFETTFTENKEALWLEGEAQVWPDRTVDILALKPQYGTVIGARVDAVLDIYRDALRKAFADTNLNILGVAP